jgi:uncharacterized protein DUF6281
MPNWGRALCVLPLAVALTACSNRSVGPRSSGSNTSGGGVAAGGAASCALVAHYQGHTYEGVGVRIAPIEGQLLGDAVLPGCDDTGGQDTPPADEVIQVAAVAGVSPDVALVWHDVTDTVLIREGTGPLPPELQELLETPSCDPGDAPIELDGPWLGIHDGDMTEVDLDTPYQIDMQVVHASSPRYQRAFLTVHVPESLGRPLSREDVERSLWKAGSISVTASCGGDGGYVAERVTTSPPV